MLLMSVLCCKESHGPMVTPMQICECDTILQLHSVGALTVQRQFTKNMNFRKLLKNLYSSE